MTGYKLVTDPEHGYLRCDPLPSQEELDKLYKDEFYTDAKPRYIERMEDDEKWWDAIYMDRVEILDEIVGHKPKAGALLDIGCGGGFFLNKAKTLFFWVEGMEPNETARAYAQSKNNYALLFDSIDKCLDRKYHAINLDMVLEHLINPLEMLQNCRRMLFDGGAICVVVPNEKLVWNEYKYVLRYPHVFQPPQHLNYFTFDSIEALMVKAGFEIYERSSTYPMETFLHMGLDYTKSEAIGRLCHTMRMSFDLSMTSQQRRKLYKELAAEGLGREAVIYARKVK